MTTSDTKTAPPLPVTIGPHQLRGLVTLPRSPKGLVIFAHGSGSGRLSPRNSYVARALASAGFATLLLDLLSETEEQDRQNVFDIPLLATRLVEATDWAGGVAELARLPLGYFGASTGAGAALLAAAQADGRVRAIVSRGGRPDLAGPALPTVAAPTLLLVGSRDEPVIELNRQALAMMHCPKRLVIIPGATHLFEEPGTLDVVIGEAIRWFEAHLAEPAPPPSIELPFPDRVQAGRALAARLAEFAAVHPLILGLPRGGVPVAFEVARALNADLDVLLVRKLGTPGQEELGFGAVIDGADPQVVLNDEVVRLAGISETTIKREVKRQLDEIERRRRLYLGTRAPIPIKDRTVIVVDDGIATGGTMRAALRGVAKARPARLILAVPVAPADTLASLASECDEVICLATPEFFHAVGAHYRDFDQTSDAQVQHLMGEAARLEAAR
jgi:predicted phosphoribosyltransferase/dienelactone hydrolase